MKWDEMSQTIQMLRKQAGEQEARIEQLERTVEEWRVYRLHEIEKGLTEVRQEVGIE